MTAGGSTALINPHVALAAAATATATGDAALAGQREGQGQAIDIVRINGWGFRTHDAMPFSQPADPAAYRVFGSTVVAPCSGLVLVAEDRLPDRPVGADATATPLGNHIILRCGARVLTLGGLKQGSVEVAPDMRIVKGRHIAQVGNSGEGDEPHLHIQLQLAAADGQPLLSGAAVPFRLIGNYPVRGEQYDLRIAR